jgi:hypothetical protein
MPNEELMEAQLPTTLYTSWDELLHVWQVIYNSAEGYMYLGVYAIVSTSVGIWGGWERECEYI